MLGWARLGEHGLEEERDSWLFWVGLGSPDLSWTRLDWAQVERTLVGQFGLLVCV